MFNVWTQSKRFCIVGGCCASFSEQHQHGESTGKEPQLSIAHFRWSQGYPMSGNSGEQGGQKSTFLPWENFWMCHYDYWSTLLFTIGWKLLKFYKEPPFQEFWEIVHHLSSKLMSKMILDVIPKHRAQPCSMPIFPCYAASWSCQLPIISLKKWASSLWRCWNPWCHEWSPLNPSKWMICWTACPSPLALPAKTLFRVLIDLATPSLCFE